MFVVRDILYCIFDSNMIGVFVMQVSFGEMIGCDKEDVSIQYIIIS